MDNNPKKKENSREQQQPPQNIFYPNYGYPYPPPPSQPGYGPPPPAVSNTAGFTTFEPSYLQTSVLNQHQPETQGLNSHLGLAVVTQGGAPVNDGGGTTQQRTSGFNKYHTTPSRTATQTRMTPSVQSTHGQQYGQHFQPYFYDPTPLNQSPNPLAHHHPPNDKPFGLYNHQHFQTGADPTNFYDGNVRQNFRIPPPNVRFNPYEQYGYDSNAPQFTPPGSYPQNYQTVPVDLVVNPPISAAAATSKPLGSNTTFHYNTCDYERRSNFQQYSRDETYELASSSSASAGTTPYMPQVETSRTHRQLSDGASTPSTSSPRFMGSTQRTDQPAISQDIMSVTTAQTAHTSTNHEGQENQQATNVTTGSIPCSSEFTALHTSPYMPQTGASPNTMTLNDNQQGYLQLNYDHQPSNEANDPVPSTPGLMGMSPYTSKPTSSQNGITSTATQPDYPLTAYNNCQPSNVTNDPVPSTPGLLGMSPYTAQPTTQNGMTSTASQPEYPLTAYNNQPSVSGVEQPQVPIASGMGYTGSGNTERTVNCFTGEGSERGMTATETTTDENEDRRRAMTLYENERLKSLYLSEELKRRLHINPNVKIEAALTQELLHQCLQGETLDQRTMERVYGSVNINSAGEKHNFSNFNVTNTYGGQEFNTPNIAPQAIQHSNFMRPPPPYPLTHVDRLAIESARDEAREAEKDLKESQEKRMEVEKKIIANEVGKRKMKTRNERMSLNRREGYLRYQYCGRATRNTHSYLQGRDEGLEEFMMQLELSEARSIEQRAAERMNIANKKLKARLDEASRIEAAGAQQHAPPAYRQDFNPTGAPLRQQNNRRGRGRRPPQSYQPTNRRCTAPNNYAQPLASTPHPPPPSYPTARASSRAQQYQAPLQTQNIGTNPPDYYQAVGTSPTEFRTLHPRRTAPYGPGRRQKVPAQGTNQNHQYPIPPVQSQRRQPNREMPHMAAPVAAPMAASQQSQWPQRNRNYPTAEANPALRGRAQNPQNPSPNMYTAPTRYPVRQTRSSARLRSDAGLAGPSGMANLPGYSYSPAQMVHTASGSGTQPSRRRMAQQRTNITGVAPAPQPRSDQTDSTNADSIENLVPTIPAIPNKIFERCLKEITPEAKKENQSCDGASRGTTGNPNTQEPLTGSPGPSSAQPTTETTSGSQNQDVYPERNFTEQELDRFLAEHASSLSANINQDDFNYEMEDF